MSEDFFPYEKPKKRVTGLPGQLKYFFPEEFEDDFTCRQLRLIRKIEEALNARELPPAVRMAGMPLRGGGQTTICLFSGFLAMMIDRSIGIVVDNDMIVRRQMTRLESAIMRSRVLGQFFPPFTDDLNWKKSKIQCRGSRLYFFTIAGMRSFRGRRPDILMIDDNKPMRWKYVQRNYLDICGRFPVVYAFQQTRKEYLLEMAEEVEKELAGE